MYIFSLLFLVACAGVWVLFNGLLFALFSVFMSSLSLTVAHSEDEPKSLHWSVVQISEDSLIQTSQFVNKN